MKKITYIFSLLIVANTVLLANPWRKAGVRAMGATAIGLTIYGLTPCKEIYQKFNDPGTHKGTTTETNTTVNVKKKKSLEETLYANFIENDKRLEELLHADFIESDNRLHANFVENEKRVRQRLEEQIGEVID